MALTLWNFTLHRDGSSNDGDGGEGDESVQEKRKLGGGDHFGKGKASRYSKES